MVLLIAGLLLFLGVHSTRIVADGWRTAMVGRMGLLGWKAVYSLLSIAGFVLIVWGYGQARYNPVVLWPALPVGVRHLASVLTLATFVLLVAAYLPGNSIKAKLHHPLVIGVKLWAFAHLLANNTLADLLLFGSLLVWAVLSFRAARKRDKAAGTVYAPGKVVPTVATVVLGVAAWAGFAMWAHKAWIGVAPAGA
jgi:uncharacterized membrane protein